MPEPSAPDLRVSEARAVIARHVEPVREVETVQLRAALGRVLARDLISPIDVPGADNSAMDGFALRGAELTGEGDSDGVFAIVGTALAGHGFDGNAASRECVRITTGAPMPRGLDTVVPQELVARDGDRVRVPRGVVGIGANRRRAGEDLARGGIALRAGRVLRPAELGIVASLGLAQVDVLRRLRVAFFSTGSELRSGNDALDAGSVYDSNRQTIWAMLQRLGVEAIDLGVVADDPERIAATLRAAANDADAVVTSGGIGVGDADHMKAALGRLGDIAFWRIAIRPGRPMAFGRIVRDDGGERAAVVFGLPGNPVAVMVAFYALVRDALIAMSGADAAPAIVLRAVAENATSKRAGRTEYPRATLVRADDGTWRARFCASQGSGVLSSMSDADALVVLEHERGDVAAGETVDAIPFQSIV